MIYEKLTPHPIDHLDEPRHWCPRSEKYTGVDSLLTALLEGWTINRRVYRHEIRLHSRSINVFYFELKRNGRVVTMAVVNNPRIDAILVQYHLHVITHTFFERPEMETREAATIQESTRETAAVGLETVEAPAAQHQSRQLAKIG
ncbi:MAG: hypothetical protein OHK0046_14190 [Anaerolineae bacterium]